MKPSSRRGPQLVRSRGGDNSTPGPPQHPFDVERGTDTGGLIPAAHLRTGLPADRHVTAYYGVAPSILRSLIQRWSQDTAPAHPVTEWIFLDVGAGKGRAMLVAAETPFREILGVELNPALAAIARSNLALAQERNGTGLAGGSSAPPPVRLIEGDARTLPLAPVPTLAFLFHPFEAAALRSFLRHVERTFAAHPGLFDLLYVNAEHLAIFERNTAFSVLWEGNVPMSTEDHAADLQEIAAQKEYGSTGDEHCAILRFVGRSPRAADY